MKIRGAKHGETPVPERHPSHCPLAVAPEKCMECQYALQRKGKKRPPNQCSTSAIAIHEESSSQTVFCTWEMANASVQRPCQRPDRKYKRCESTQTITAGNYAKTAERGQGRAATVC